MRSGGGIVPHHLNRNTIDNRKGAVENATRKENTALSHPFMKDNGKCPNESCGHIGDLLTFKRC